MSLLDGLPCNLSQTFTFPSGSNVITLMMPSLSMYHHPSIIIRWNFNFSNTLIHDQIPSLGTRPICQAHVLFALADASGRAYLRFTQISDRPGPCRANHNCLSTVIWGRCDTMSDRGASLLQIPRSPVTHAPDATGWTSNRSEAFWSVHRL